MAQHARLGASSSSIWLNCTKAGELFGTPSDTPRKETIFTAEGTAAHELAEQCLLNDEDPKIHIGLPMYGVTVTDEMARGVQVYLDECKRVAGKSYAVELQVSLNNLWPNGDNPEDLFGTGDFVSLNGSTLYVRDLKYGAGVGVEVYENPQLLYYGLGSLLAFMNDKQQQIETIDIGIVQPRYVHPDGPVRSFRISKLDLLLWGADVKDTVEDIVAGRTEYKTGSHCRWCGVAGRCPALRQKAAETAKVDFSPVDLSLSTLPDITTLTPEQMANIVDGAELISAFVAQVKAAAAHTIETGVDVPGYKLVSKRAQRRWVEGFDVSAVAKVLGSTDYKSGVNRKMYETKLVSPAQAEKLFKQHGEDFSVIEKFITKESSGTTLVRDQDARQSVNAGPKSAFTPVDL